MLHGISFVKVDCQPLQQAIANKATKDHISYLKQAIAYNATIGYQYDEVPFTALSAILSNDYAFNPFKFKDISEGAIYNKEAYPHPHGRIRGRSNVTGNCTWVCLDIDDTIVSDSEMHSILSNFNHHIARTSNPDNQFKYRIILPLSKAVDVPNTHWKFFIGSIAASIHCSADLLARSALIIGYDGREVLSVLDKQDIDPTKHLQMANTKVVELEEKRATAIPRGEASAALQQPYSTFSAAYDCKSGDGNNLLLWAIHKAKEYGAPNDYIVDLVHSINSFWDHPMPEHRLQATILTAIQE